MRDVTDGSARAVMPVHRVVRDLRRLLDGPAHETRLPVVRVNPEITQAILAGRPAPASNLAVQVDSALEDGSLGDSGVSRSVLQRVADLDPSELQETEPQVIRLRPPEPEGPDYRVEPGAPEEHALADADDRIELPDDHEGATANGPMPVSGDVPGPGKASWTAREAAADRTRSPAFRAPERIDYGTLFTRLRQTQVTASAS